MAAPSVVVGQPAQSGYYAVIMVSTDPTPLIISDLEHPFTNSPDCWEWAEHQLETGEIKLGEGTKVVCIRIAP